MPEPGKIFSAARGTCALREIFTPGNSGLDCLSAAELRLSRTASPPYAFPGRELLLFNLAGPVECRVDETTHTLEHYDVLYIGVGSRFQVIHQESRGGENGDDEARLYIYRAPGTEVHPAFHSPFEGAKSNEERIRRLHRKVVYKMFDISESANKFMAGYTFYEDHTRAWPPHNHTDQEEVYSFIEGSGAMTVYENDEKQTFVTSVAAGDHVTIPVLNYHPVFSHESPLCFIWCIAGERYWVGDKNTDFMAGGKQSITT